MTAPPPRGEVSLRTRFSWFTLAVCCALVCVFAFNTFHQRDVAVGVALRETANLAESLEQQASDTFDAASGALDAIAQRVARDGTTPSSRLRLFDTMTALVATLPRIHYLIVVDEHGRLVVSNFALKGAHMPSVTDRSFFAYHQTHRDDAVHISGPAVNKTDTSWVLFATRRLNRADGTFAGVAIAPIALRYFERSYANVDVGVKGNITLFADDGTIMVRKPLMSIGRRFPAAGLFVGANRTARSGWYIGRSHVDETTRLFAFRRLNRYPLAVLVAIAESEYLAEWRADTRTNAIVLIALIVLIGVLANALYGQIGQRKRAEDTLARLAMFDELTGLANRRQFDEVLEREWRHAVRTQASLALMMIDVDFFKRYNDVYGHQAGDRALARVAAAIAAEVHRPGDLAARYGGEEFVVILRETDDESARTVAERIRTAVVALNVTHAGAASGVVSVSIGVAATVPQRRDDPTMLIETADGALYDAKHAGRNCVAVRAFGAVVHSTATESAGETPRTLQ